MSIIHHARYAQRRVVLRVTVQLWASSKCGRISRAVRADHRPKVSKVMLHEQPQNSRLVSCRRYFGSVASLSAVASLLDFLLCTRPAFAFSPSSPYQTRRASGNCSQARSVTSGTLRLSGRRSAGIAHGTGRVLLPQLVHLSGEAQVTGWGGEWCFNVLLGHPHAILNEYH